MSVLAAEPDHLPALMELASLYKGKGLLAEAREALERAAATAPDDARVAQALATVVTDLGTAAKGAGRLEDAAALYRAALERWPTLAAAHYNLVRRGLGGGAMWEPMRAGQPWLGRAEGCRVGPATGLAAAACQPAAPAGRRAAPQRTAAPTHTTIPTPAARRRACSRARRGASDGPRRWATTAARSSATRATRRRTATWA
jgi:hypothetical protein